MSHHKPPGWDHQVREIFSHISNRYDLINALMTFGQDQSWRHYVVGMAGLPTGGRLLDTGTGTGKIALDAVRNDPSLSVAAADFSLEMLRIGHRRARGKKVLWCLADALMLPFSEATFDAVTSGYLVRNVIDIYRAFEEQKRVVKPGGRVVCLETSPPPRNLIRPFILFYLNIVIPIVGSLISGSKKAYQYLPQTTQVFLEPEELASIMKDVGLKDVRYQRFMFGTVVVVVGIRPEEDSD